MLNNSIAPSSMASTLPVSEDYADFEIMLSIITGSHQDAIDRVRNWNQAERLYALIEKYQIESHRPWFSQMCSNHADGGPWTALLLGCNQSPLDTIIIRTAISQGFRNRKASILLVRSYFVKVTKHKHETLDSSNISMELGVRLGHIGLLAYKITFSGLEEKGNVVDWDSLAERFAGNVRAIEKTIKAQANHCK